MPVYQYKCSNGHEFDRYLPLKDYKEPQTCECGAACTKVLCAPMINCDMQPWDRYISPVSGRPITSYKERRKDMADHGCVDYEPSLRTEQTNRLHQSEARLEKKMDETVEAEIEKMPTRKREKLESELNSGADCAYARK